MTSELFVGLLVPSELCLKSTRARRPHWRVTTLCNRPYTIASESLPGGLFELFSFSEQAPRSPGAYRSPPAQRVELIFIVRMRAIRDIFRYYKDDVTDCSSGSDGTLILYRDNYNADDFPPFLSR